MLIRIKSRENGQTEWGQHMSNKKNLRRITVRVTAQTAYNLGKLAAMCGHRDLGRVIDKLTREKMISLGEWRK